MPNSLEVITHCAHGWDRWHPIHPIPVEGPIDCSGGSRRVLTEGEYVLIEKVVIAADVKEWPDKVLLALEGKHWTGIAETLDALAGGES